MWKLRHACIASFMPTPLCLGHWLCTYPCCRLALQHCTSEQLPLFFSFFALHSGVDVVPIMEYLGLPESVISPLRKSGLNYIATASAMYKLATPARYTVTLGGTSVAIRALVKRGLIKPMPTRGELRQMLRDKMK